MDALHCVEVTLHSADGASAEWVEASLWSLGLSGLERQDGDTWSELVDEAIPLAPGTVRWRLYRPPERTLHEDEAEVREVLPDHLPLTLRAWVIDDLSFLESWKEHFRPTQVSPRLIVHPPWEPAPASWEGARVCIEPGMAFGSGTHETTRLCMRAIDRLVGDAAVLDVGCGSGILAIAAALLGAPTVLATDNDPLATSITRENVRLNAVEAHVVVTDDPLEALEGRFGLVVANILPHVLVELRDALLARVASQGSLVLSGILAADVERFWEAFALPGLSVELREDDGIWTALTCRWAPAAEA